MFRKPKRAVKTGIRRRADKDDNEVDAGSNDEKDDEEEESAAELLSQARKRLKAGGTSTTISSTSTRNEDAKVMHQFETSNEDLRKKNADLITSTVQTHSEKQAQQMAGGEAGRGEDGIFRDKTRSKLLAGPIKATTHIRTTCRFDYQPDICKDYKDTGFCGFGDTCIYLHDRGDTMSGWQLEKQWEEEQKKKKEQQEREIQGFMDSSNGKQKSRDDNNGAITTDDGLPFACHICREAFTNPVVTTCGHYFCEKCIMNRVRTESESCPICGKDTHAVFNQPTKLLAKKRRVLGASAASKDDSWKAFLEAFAASKEEST